MAVDHLWAKRNGQWRKQNAFANLYYRLEDEWRQIIAVFEKVDDDGTPTWKKRWIPPFDANFEEELVDGGEITFDSSGTLRLEVTGKGGDGGKGGKGGRGGKLTSISVALFGKKLYFRGGGGGGGGGGSRSTGATAISHIDVVPGDTWIRDDTSDAVRVKNKDTNEVLALADNGRNGANGDSGDNGRDIEDVAAWVATGGKGGKGGKGGSRGTASNSIGNESTEPGSNGKSGYDGDRGERFIRNRPRKDGEGGDGGDKSDAGGNDGKDGEDGGRGVRDGYGGDGGSGQKGNPKGKVRITSI